MCSCSSLPVLLTEVIGCFDVLEVLDHRGRVRWTGDTQCSCKGSPSKRFLQALRIGMQPRTPTRKITCRVNNDGDAMLALVIIVELGHYPNQIDGQLSLPAPDTRPHRTGGTAMLPCDEDRILALDHGSVYRYRNSALNQRRLRFAG